MKQVWIAEEMDGDVLLAPYLVLKETEKQYHCQENPGGRLLRINKEYLDKEPGPGGGKYFSAWDKALDILMKYHMRKIEDHKGSLAALTAILAQGEPGV